MDVDHGADGVVKVEPAPVDAVPPPVAMKVVTRSLEPIAATIISVEEEAGPSTVPVPKKEEDRDGPKPIPYDPGKPHYTTRYILSGHSRSISAVKFSPDGKLLASCAADKLIKIWNVDNGEIVYTLKGHDEGVSDIACASDDKSVRTWSLEEGIEVKRLLGHTNFVFCVTYNPTSNLIASGGFDETVRIWDAIRGRLIRVMPAHSDPVTSVDFSHDGTMLVSCAMDGLIRIWDTESGQCLKTLVDDDNPICSHVHFTPNSKFVLASTQDSTVRLWNYQASRCAKTYTGHSNRTFCIPSGFATSRMGERLVLSGSEDSRVYVWDLQTRQLVQVLEGHKDVVLGLSVHPTKCMLATGAMEKDLTIRIWEDVQV
ncbi:WD40-repeat-containing domain protein [Schizophyllum amplum]|uniref:WD40-repeat-containing domain protein n=1 Tax=Schizophyllum amplum TaxID=97359 RepID=A0A550CLV8_9AGAR|nr:WD40-repeat-containing domain protein [Auriculariopsis ampla]